MLAQALPVMDAVRAHMYLQSNARSTDASSCMYVIMLINLAHQFIFEFEPTNMYMKSVYVYHKIYRAICDTFPKGHAYIDMIDVVRVLLCMNN